MQRISNTFKSVGGVEIGTKTIGRYLENLQDSFIISEALRYDVKGRKYIGTGTKYYFEDNLDRNEQYDVFRFWATSMFSEHAGILGRFEYSEQVGSTDVSAMFGPVFYF